MTSYEVQQSQPHTRLGLVGVACLASRFFSVLKAFTSFFSSYSSFLPGEPRTSFLFTLFRTAVSFWGQTTQILSNLSPKRDCGPRRVSSFHDLFFHVLPPLPGELRKSRRTWYEERTPAVFYSHFSACGRHPREINSS